MVAAIAKDEEAGVVQLKDKSEEVKIAELDYQINNLYQPQIDTMQDQIAALMTQVEQLMKQIKAKNA